MLQGKNIYDLWAIRSLGDMEIPEWGLSLPECCALGDREFVDVAVSVVWLKRTANMLGGFAPYSSR